MATIPADSAPLVLLSGVDTLEVNTHNMLRSEVVDAIKRAQERARDAGRPVELELGGVDWEVLPHGNRHAPFVLRNGDVSFWARETPAALATMPNVYATLSSTFLQCSDWAVAWRAFLALFGELLRPIGDAHAEAVLSGGVATVTRGRIREDRESWQLSRVDLCSDFQGWTPTLEDVDNFCRPPRLKWSPICAGDSMQTLNMGNRGAIFMRLYDKKREIVEASGKSWFEDLWSQTEGYDPGADVWRLEFQLRREPLKSFQRAGGPDRPRIDGVRTVDDLGECYGDLWRYLCGAADGPRRKGWVSLRKPTRGARGKLLAQKFKWEVDPRWAALRDAQVEDQPIRRVDTRRARVAESLAPGLAGYASSMLADLALGDHGDPKEITAALTSSEWAKPAFGRATARLVARSLAELGASLDDFTNHDAVAMWLAALMRGGCFRAEALRREDALNVGPEFGGVDRRAGELATRLLYRADRDPLASAPRAALEDVAADVLALGAVDVGELEGAWSSFTESVPDRARRKTPRRAGLLDAARALKHNHDVPNTTEPGS